jgi:hypothetical protein
MQTLHRRADVDDASDAAVEVAGRLGLLARGTVYALVGLLTIRVASSDPARADQQGALHVVARQPLGTALLWVLAAGLAGYAVWRLVSAVRTGDDDDHPWLERVKHVASAAVYGVLAVGAASIAMGGDGGGSRRQASGVTAEVMSWPLGPWLAGAVGLVVIGIGLNFAWEGLSRRFLEDLHTERLGRRSRRAVEALGVIGHTARGAVFCTIGWFLIKAALEYDPSEAAGLDVALHRLAGASYGTWLLAAVGVGFLAFAAFCFVQAALRRITD